MCCVKYGACCGADVHAASHRSPRGRDRSRAIFDFMPIVFFTPTPMTLPQKCWQVTTRFTQPLFFPRRSPALRGPLARASLRCIAAAPASARQLMSPWAVPETTTAVPPCCVCRPDPDAVRCLGGTHIPPQAEPHFGKTNTVTTHARSSKIASRRTPQETSFWRPSSSPHAQCRNEGCVASAFWAPRDTRRHPYRFCLHPLTPMLP